MSFTDLTSIIQKLDTNVNAYNGSIVNIPGKNLLLIAWRATVKPFSSLNASLPPFPYQWVKGYFANQNNYIGLGIFDKKTRKVVHFCKYNHSIGKNRNGPISNSILQLSLDRNNNVFMGPEDPRLYLDGKDIYMNYVCKIVDNETKTKDGKEFKLCDPLCSTMFLIKLDLNKIFRNEYYDNDKAIILCETVDTKDSRGVLKMWK